MRVTKVSEQQVGAVKFDIYELVHSDGGNHIPNTVSLDEIIPLLSVVPLISHRQYRAVIHRFDDHFTLLIKIKQRGCFFYQKLSDSYDLGDYSFEDAT